MKSLMYTKLPLNTLNGLFLSAKICRVRTGSREISCFTPHSPFLNIAEGNGKATEADRRHFFEIARGSTLECAAIQDVLEVCGAIKPEESRIGKDLLDRIAAMLTKIGGRGYTIKEDDTGIA